MNESVKRMQQNDRLNNRHTIIKMQRDLLRINHDLNSLSGVTCLLYEAPDFNTLMKSAGETLLDAMKVDACWIQLSDNTEATPFISARNNIYPESLPVFIEKVRNQATTESGEVGYFTLPGENHAKDWHIAITSIISKQGTLGSVCVATNKFEFDQYHEQLFVAIIKQLAVAIERNKLYTEVQISRDNKENLIHQLISTREEECKRISRKLHDGACQSLTALRLGLGELSFSLSAHKNIKKQILKFQDLCRQIEDEIDNVVLDLRPTLLDDLGLVEAIRFYINSRHNGASMTAKISVIGHERRLSNDVESTLFRIIQEGISNVIKHSNAANLAIELQYEKTSLILRIEDDGCGFDIARIVNPSNPRRGMGLLGIKERTNLINGNLKIFSRTGTGTVIEITVPQNQARE